MHERIALVPCKIRIGFLHDFSALYFFLLVYICEVICNKVNAQ